MQFLATFVINHNNVRERFAQLLVIFRQVNLRFSGSTGMGNAKTCNAFNFEVLLVVIFLSFDLANSRWSVLSE